MLAPNEQGANTLINRMGTNCKIESRFYLAKDAKAGDKVIKLATSIGLDPTNKLEIAATNPLNPFEIETGGSELVTIAAIDGNQITLESPLTSSFSAKSVLFKDYSIKCMPLIKSTDVTREDVEFIRRIRVRRDLVATYGSRVYYQNRWFFVTGYDISDLTLLLKLREIGETIHIVSGDRSGKDNGYSFNRDNPSYLYKDVQCWFNHLSSSAELEDPGFLPETYQMVIIPNILDVKIGDYILRDDGDLVYKVTGVDDSKITGFHNLTVNLDNSVNLKETLDKESDNEDGVGDETPETVTPIVPEIPPGVIDDDW